MSVTRSTLAPTRRLPQQPSLEQLRKQSKDLLHDFHAGVAVAIAEVNRFERKPSTAFALSDAQRVIARAYGFASWPKLKAFVDGANIARFVDAVNAGDVAQVRTMLASRPELIAMDRSASDEHRGLHYAVLRRDPTMVRLLMEAGADARQGIFPHRDATSALALAQDREYDDIVAVIEEEERHRREEMSCSNATVSPIQDQISSAISRGDDATAIHLLESDHTLIHACDRDGERRCMWLRGRTALNWLRGSSKGGRTSVRKTPMVSRHSIMPPSPPIRAMIALSGFRALQRC